MKLEDLTFHNLAFEVRYPQNYRHWDRAGEIWTRLVEKWPQLQLEQGKPNVTKFRWGGLYELRIELDKAVVVCRDPELNRGRKLAVDVVACLTDLMDVRILSRLGLRIVFKREFANEADAASYVITNAPLVCPTGKYFEIEGGEITHPDVSFRWESENRGVTIRFKFEELTVEINAPPEIRELAKMTGKKKHWFASLDVDQFTKGDTPVSKFDAATWWDHAVHLMRRDSVKLIQRA